MQDAIEEKVKTLMDDMLRAEDGNYPRALRAACRLVISYSDITQNQYAELLEKNTRLKKMDEFLWAFKALLEDGDKS